jgi:hypothetical protein
VKHAKDVAKRRLFRRITIGPEERLRTASERLALLDLDTMAGGALFGLLPLSVQSAHDEAFDVEAVTKTFYEEYVAAFKALQKDLFRQTNERTWAHDYALQFLNRCMFLYFIQRKRWLGDDPQFLTTYWDSYRKGGQAENSFFDQWLKVLFFEAFNARFHGGHRQFPEAIRDALQMAPYLNGGLFKENGLDRAQQFTVADAQFKAIYDFLERYNFTIAEDSPLDKEVAVDPEMIGKVYESLVNVSEEADERGDAGIFYTPRTEIDLMCRLAVVDHLANHLGPGHKNLLYELVFALDAEEKEAADRAIGAAGLWPLIMPLLEGLTVLDPACGSGSFLVGTLHILDDLQERAGRQADNIQGAYERKKQIIGRSLYGVDVMEWAGHVAELRLWLALIVDAELSPAERHSRAEPLLPDFTFHIRCGDSLVQEVGGLNLGRHRHGVGMPADAKRRLSLLQREKLLYYNNDPARRFTSKDLLAQEELLVFRAILEARLKTVRNEIQRLRAPAPGRQPRLGGMGHGEARPLPLKDAELEVKRASGEAEAEELVRALSALQRPKDLPFVWDIAFVEIFEGDKAGFDIVVGNPPYVRQEAIADPDLPREAVTKENKKEYKAKLQKAVYQAYPRFFGFKEATEQATRKMDAKSDLYIYFYFHGLSLLNPKGSFCFITSNSWLDVGYGKDLQEFLLNHAQVKLVLENHAKRSFASADVNTVITLLSAPNERKWEGLEQIARFVQVTVPFEEALSPVLFEEIEAATGRVVTPEYRIHATSQKVLLEEGQNSTYEEEEATGAAKTSNVRRSLVKTVKYFGDKWGGKYLRAPDVYWTILEKGKGKLVRLGDIAEVRFGIKTGVNDFFYLDEEEVLEWRIEEEFLAPVILRPSEILVPVILPPQIKLKLFQADESRKSLQGTRAEAYIRWGEGQGFHQTASCAARGDEWYRLGKRIPADLLMPIGNKMRLVLGINQGEAQADNNLIEIRLRNKEHTAMLGPSLLCSVGFILRHIEGRSYGRSIKVQTYEASRLLVLQPDQLERGEERALLRAFNPIAGRPFEWMTKEIDRPDRQELDRAWLTAVGFSPNEVNAALNAIYAHVRKLSEEMNSQEKAWVHDRAAARKNGNPQDIMKGKRKKRHDHTGDSDDDD